MTVERISLVGPLLVISLGEALRPDVRRDTKPLQDIRGPSITL